MAWPGRIARAELLAAQPGGGRGPYSPYAVRMTGGDPGDLAAVRERRAGVQDEGSQLCALALAAAPLDGPRRALARPVRRPGRQGRAAGRARRRARCARCTANELREHRAELVRQVTAAWAVDVRVGDAREFPALDGGYDRVLLDAPCTGLGALRRRPEARWRRRPDDVAELATLQRELLAAALRLVRPGGVVAYVTCSPHPAETVDVVAGPSCSTPARPSPACPTWRRPDRSAVAAPARHGRDVLRLRPRLSAAAADHGPGRAGRGLAIDSSPCPHTVGPSR